MPTSQSKEPDTGHARTMSVKSPESQLSKAGSRICSALNGGYEILAQRFRSKQAVLLARPTRRLKEARPSTIFFEASPGKLWFHLKFFLALLIQK